MVGDTVEILTKTKCLKKPGSRTERKSLPPEEKVITDEIRSW